MINKANSFHKCAQQEGYGACERALGAEVKSGGGSFPTHTHFDQNRYTLTVYTLSFCLILILKRIPVALKSLKTPYLQMQNKNQ